jgi:hypothetical protein
MLSSIGMSKIRFVPFIRRFIPFGWQDSCRPVALSARGRFGAQASSACQALPVQFTPK